MEKEKTLISATGLKERGWTAKQIAECLGEPDQLKTNPMFRSAAPMRLWSIERVDAAEKTEHFAQLQAKAERRREASVKAAERRKQKLIGIAGTVPITIKVVSLNSLVRLTLENKADYYLRREEYGEIPSSAPKEVILRWCYNYARHNLSDYHNLLNSNKGIPGVDEAYEIIKTRILQEAERVYPPSEILEAIEEVQSKKKGR